MKKILIIIALILSMQGLKAQGEVVFNQHLKVDLNNGDVRKMIIQVWNKKGYKLLTAYRKNDKWVLMFKLKGNIKKFTSK